jgi:hypothetical protein
VSLLRTKWVGGKAVRAGRRQGSISESIRDRCATGGHFHRNPFAVGYLLRRRGRPIGLGASLEKQPPDLAAARQTNHLLFRGQALHLRRH